MTIRATRGRPLKFGRPSRLVALTLPEDVLETLRSRNEDVARAIVGLVSSADPTASRASARARVVDVVRMSRREGLIIVDPSVIPALPGCTLIRIAHDRAFIALEQGAGLAELEIAVLDRLGEAGVTRDQRAGLRMLRGALKKWRKDRRVAAYPRSIVVLKGPA
jgi:hypothetical protein